MAEFVQNNQPRHHQAGCQDKRDESHAAQLSAAELREWRTAARKFGRPRGL